MSWSKRRASVAPKTGTVLSGVAAMLVLSLIVATGIDTAGPAPAASSVTYHSAATLTGPITVGHIVEPLSAHPLDLAANGYVEQEFFASGTATASKADALPSDGKWTI